MLHKVLNGADLHAPTNYLVENNTGSPISKMKVVTFNGIGTNFPSVIAISSYVEPVRGIVMNDISEFSGQNVGYITSLGFMIDVDTSAWIEGTKLYSDTFGNLTDVPGGVLVATVYKQDAVNGQLFVENGSQSGGGSGGGDVFGPVSATDNAISRYDGITGKLIQNSKALLQDGGGIQTQAIMVNRSITDTVMINSNYSMITPEIELEDGELIIEGDAEIVII